MTRNTIGLSLFFLSAVLLVSFQNCTPNVNNSNSSSLAASDFSGELQRAIAGEVEDFRFSGVTSMNDAGSVLEPSDFTGYDIIVIAGQSNAVGAGKWPGGIVGIDPLKADVPELDERIFQVNRYEPQLSLVSGSETLQHIGFRDNKDAVGFGMSFARRYVAGLNKSRKVILIPAARGGVSIDEWLGGEVIDPVTNQNINLLESLRERLSFALSQKSVDGKPLANKFVALLWQHGEADIRKAALKLDRMTAESYVEKMDLLFAAIKQFHREQRFSIIIGEPVPSWNSVMEKEIQLDITDIKQAFKRHLVDNTESNLRRSYVRTSSDRNGLEVLKSNCDSGAGEDCIHYDAPSQIELGKRYYSAYLKTVVGGLAGLRITNSDKFNASPNVVDDILVSSAGEPSHLLDVGMAGLPVKLGIDDRGGGYVNYLELFNDNINRVAPKFGRGMQTAFRDGVHFGKYNPTQAGYSDVGGAKVTVLQTKDAAGTVTALRIPQFNAPLFNGDAEFDFVQAPKSVITQPDNYADEADWDLLDEAGKSYSDEIKSEFDYAGKYEKVTQDFGIPAFRHTFYYSYNRKPNAILQFINPEAKKANGDFLLNLSKVIQDISPAAGVQTPHVTDLSDIIFRTFSGRIQWDPTMFNNFYYYYKVGDNWTGKRMEINPLTGDRLDGEKLPPYFDLVDNTSKYIYVEGSRPVKPDSGVRISEDLLILSNVCVAKWIATCPQELPKKAVSMAYYYPLDDQVNKYPVVVMNRSDMSIHREENRIMQLGFGLGYRDLGQIEFAAVRMELRLSGLLSPLRYQNDKHQDRFEAIRQKIYMLFSHQPEEIVDAVSKFRVVNFPK